jgi:Mrp family chromosome partitioning ATPase
MERIMGWLNRIADIVVIDSAPVLPVTDTVVLSPRIDGVLLIVKPGSTKLDACRQALEQLQRAGANLLGVVLNDIQLNRTKYSYYRYSGRYTYSDQDGEPNSMKAKSSKFNLKKERI